MVKRSRLKKTKGRKKPVRMKRVGKGTAVNIFGRKAIEMTPDQFNNWLKDKTVWHIESATGIAKKWKPKLYSKRPKDFYFPLGGFILKKTTKLDKGPSLAIGGHYTLPYIKDKWHGTKSWRAYSYYNKNTKKIIVHRSNWSK